ncbi:MAG: hypothetical protein MJZ07_07505, partial [Bacteroidales bacterium]|nr:hypothetical protein [Bacteroidales bacterium]
MKFRLFLSACVMALMAGLSSCSKDGRPITNAEVFLGTEPLGPYLVTRVDSLSYLNVRVEPVNAKERIYWEIADQSVIMEYSREDNTGRKVSLIALSEGETVVRLTTESGFKTEFLAIVYANPPMLTGLRLEPESMTLKLGESSGVKAIVIPADAQESVSFEISDPTILEYDWEEDGEYLFSAIKIGKSKIVATCGDFSAECEVNVVSNLVPLTGVKLNQTSYSAPAGERFEIKPVFTPSNASNKVMKWVITDTNIADFEGTVDGTAEFVAKNVGTTAIRGMSLDGYFTVSATIKVTPPIAPAGGVDLGYRYGDRPVFFRKYNLGTSELYFYGHYLAWGDKTQYFEMDGPSAERWHSGKEKGYSKDSYKWYDSSLKTYTKYMNEPKNISLSLEDDPAHQILGGCWRMPNVADLFWLKNNCRWTADYDHLSYVVSSNVPGFEDQSIIIPMTGYYMDTRYHGFGQIVKG